ncbi:dihydromonapterin reductase [Neptunomonas phycophila]|uniref:Dihydromonapterin reductase n=1 Tax=Neptunomonas phycophila TaxID=1572645 RepID=A0ABT9EYS1_9GAMM|nr:MULTISPECIES: dihydromonapterin reductase [Neptunomonas]MDN2660351.1 dihydromonapterin reductase [Neptunomonas sp. CHC150]MDP2524161.1 dihydromonapterin reductase [Neptunomonas phycophila]
MTQSNPQAPILITGVGKRIGLAIAKHLLAQGQPIIGTYRTHYESIDELQAQGAELYCCDLYDQAAVLNLINTLDEQHPTLRGIIHNASDWIPESSNLPPEVVFQKMMQVHAGAPYEINRLLSDKLLAYSGEHADIIHMTDYVASKGSKKHIAYAASKAALDNMTLSFSAQLAPRVKVNAIAPAMIMFNDDDDDAYRAKTLKKSLMEIAPGTDEILEAVDYLLKSRYVTGRTLHVDGGRHLK